MTTFCARCARCMLAATWIFRLIVALAALADSIKYPSKECRAIAESNGVCFTNKYRRCVCKGFSQPDEEGRVGFFRECDYYFTECFVAQKFVLMENIKIAVLLLAACMVLMKQKRHLAMKEVFTIEVAPFVLLLLCVGIQLQSGAIFGSWQIQFESSGLPVCGVFAVFSVVSWPFYSCILSPHRGAADYIFDVADGRDGQEADVELSSRNES